MKEPKRYYCGNGEGMFEDDNGHWIEYSEHKAIVETLTEQLRKHAVTYEFLCERFEFGRDKKCEQQCSDYHWMQTKLNQPTVVGQSEQCAYTSTDIRTLRCNCCNDCGEILEMID